MPCVKKRKDLKQRLESDAHNMAADTKDQSCTAIVTDHQLQTDLLVSIRLDTMRDRTSAYNPYYTQSCPIWEALNFTPFCSNPIEQQGKALVRVVFYLARFRKRKLAPRARGKPELLWMYGLYQVRIKRIEPHPTASRTTRARTQRVFQWISFGTSDEIGD